MDRRAFVGLIVLLVETSKAFAGGTVAEFVVLPPRLAPVSLGRGAVYADSQTGRVRFLDTMGGSIEAGTADRIQTLSVAPNSPSEGRIYGNTVSHLLNYWDGSAWQALASAGGYVPNARQILTTAPLAGGGNLSTDRALSLTLAGTPGLWVTGGGLAVLPKPASGIGVDAGGVYVAPTAVSAGAYPATGQIPTFTVSADGRLTAASSTPNGANLTGLLVSIVSAGANGGLNLGGRCYLTSPGVACNLLARPVAVVTRAGLSARNLRCWSATAPGGSLSAVYTVQVNGADSALTCQVMDPAMACSDLTHAPSLSAGDRLGVASDNPLLDATTLPTCSFELTN